MPAELEILFANPEPDACPATFSEAVGILRTLVSGTSLDANTPYVVQDETPSVGQQAYIWFQTQNGKPIAIRKFYSGVWRKVYSGIPGEVKMFFGDPTGHFDGTGKGIVGDEWDGWQLMNGQNGTADLSDRFLVGGHMNNANSINGYSSGWRSIIAGSPVGTGGVKEITLTDANTYQRPVVEIKVGRQTADGNAAASGGPLYGQLGTPNAPVTLQEADAGNLTPPVIPIIPPFFALAFVQFVSYD